MTRTRSRPTSPRRGTSVLHRAHGERRRPYARLGRAPILRAHRARRSTPARFPPSPASRAVAARPARLGSRLSTTAAAAAASSGDASASAFADDDDALDESFDSFDDDDDDGWEVTGELSSAELAAINGARSDEETDGTYFDSYSHIGIHREMIGDAARTGAYLAAIEAHAEELKDKVVLDVGCGTGILSMFAARAGARKVYAVDASGITRHTRRLVRDNGFDDVIEIIRGRMEDLTYDDITEPVDCVVSEWMGYALFFESMLPSVVDARDRFMKPGGLVFPNVAVVRVALLSDQGRYDGAVTFWKDVYGFDFSALIPQTKRDWSSDPPVTTVDPACVVSAPAEVVSVDCASVPLDDLFETMAGDVRLVADRDATVHGMVLWFDVDFYGRARSCPRHRRRPRRTGTRRCSCSTSRGRCGWGTPWRVGWSSSRGAIRAQRDSSTCTAITTWWLWERREGRGVDPEDREFFSEWVVQ